MDGVGLFNMHITLATARLDCIRITLVLMKKALKETQTLHAGCSKMHPKMFAPAQTPFPGAGDGQNLINWRRSLPLPMDPVW